MTSYKIHSIKDSEKLSFIIEGESESSLTQKLSTEGHIILSVEKIETTLHNLFSFEGKKTDGSFIDGKISADDIFLAYDMLVKEYKYTITKLYPETIQDKKKQEKIFQELLLSFQENNTQKKEKKVDTTKQELLRYKKLLQKLIEILESEGGKNQKLITELKKTDQNNNIIAFQQSLKETLKLLGKNRKNNPIFPQIKPLMKEMGIFILPDMWFNLFEKMQNVSESLSPLVHPVEVQPQRHIHEENISQKEAQEEYDSIQKNNHIHTFLRKKYRSKFFHIFNREKQKYFTYTLLRERNLLFFAQGGLKNLHQILTIGIFITLFLTLLAVLFGIYTTIFVPSEMMGIFLVLIFATLVIQSETV